MRDVATSGEPTDATVPRTLRTLRTGGIVAALLTLALFVAGCGTYDRRVTRSTDSTTSPDDATAAAGSPAWIRLPEAPTARTEVGAAYLDGFVYAAGGIGVDGGSGRVLSTFEAFDVSGSTWKTLPELPRPRHHAAVAGLDGTIYVMGGYTDIAFTPSSEVFTYDVASGRWRKAPPLPEPLGAGGAAVVEGKIYYVGGTDASGKTSGRLYSFDGSTWRRLRDMPTPREHLAVAATSTFLYAIGGRHPITAAAERYDPDEDSWETLAPKPTARGGIAGAGVGGRFACAAGGEDDRGTYADAECFDETIGRWVVLPPMSVARHGLGAAGTEKNFYAVAGGDQPGLARTAVFESISVS